MGTVTTEDMADSSITPESLAEEKQHNALDTLAAEGLSDLAEATVHELEHSFDTMHSQAATQGSNMISNANHSYVTNNKPETSDFSTNSTGSHCHKQSKLSDGVYRADHCSELVSQEMIEFTNIQATFVSDEHEVITSMEVEQVFVQGAALELHQEVQQGLHQEVDLGLHQEVNLGLHEEAQQGLREEAQQGLPEEAQQGLREEAQQGLQQETDPGLHHEAEHRLHQEIELSGIPGTVAAAGRSESIKSKFNCFAFIGPVVPTGHQLQSQTVGEDAYGDSDAIIREHHHDLHKSNVSSADDSRYNLTLGSVPRLAASTSGEFLQVEENFLRGCKWSPDGSCVLTNSNDNCLRIFNPCNETGASRLTDNTQMTANVRMKECSLVYDYAWHPKMNLAQSDHCRVACTCSGIPIHMWDTTTGQIVANYRAYDQFDEITAAYSLSFSLDGQKIYAGYNKAIRIFDTDYPVRSCKTVKTYNSQRKDGQTGIISSFAFSPDGNGLYVAGSYSRHIGLYDSACDKLVCLMQGQHGGVTHLMFSPDATKLYSGGRKDAEILCWDMRNMDKLLFSALRDVKTNQRMYFDLSQSGRYLVSGNNDGTVAFWDTFSPIEEINGDPFLKPCSQFQAHGDCVNGVSFNHHKNLLATASGQRHFQNFDYDSSDSAEDENMQQTDSPDFSLRLWQIPLLS